MNALETAKPRPWFTDVSRASVFLALGDTAHALDYLERSARATGPMWITFISLQDPAFDILRPNHRFAALVRDAGLDVGHVTSPHGGRVE